MAARRHAPPAPRAAPVPSSATHPSAGRLRSVVLVEDHGDLRAILTEVLTHMGWAVRAFVTADEALAFVRKPDLPDVVLTDFNTGALSGPALARELRSDPSTRSLVIIGMSGSVEPTPRMLSFFDAFLPKPLDVMQLDGVLRRLLGTA